MSDQGNDDNQRREDDYSDEEAARRRDAVIKRMLNTPPQPRRKKSMTPIPKAKERPTSKGRVHNGEEPELEFPISAQLPSTPEQIVSFDSQRRGWG
jgi:hypothetical protein